MLYKNQVIYCAIRSLPAVVWVLSYGVTIFSPECLKTLSLSFRMISEGPARQLKEDFDNSTGGALPGYGYPQTSEWYLVKQILLYPFRSLYNTLHLTLHLRGEGDGGHRAGVLKRCVTALFLHPSRPALLNSLINYLYALTLSKPVYGRCREAVEDTVFSILGASLGNLFLVWQVRALSEDGMFLPGMQEYMKQKPALTRALAMTLDLLLPLLRIVATLAARAAVLRRISPLHNLPPSEADVAPPTGGGEGEEGGGETGPVLRPRFAYYCGGEGVGYALSGFRFIYRNEATQLTGTSWSIFVDTVQIFVNQAELVMFPRARTGWWWWPVGRPSAAPSSSPSEGRQERIAEGIYPCPVGTADRLFTAASSVHLQMTNVVSFMGGMLLGYLYKHALSSLWLCYRIPLLSSVAHFLHPLPPPKIAIPEELYRAARPELPYVRIYRDHRETSSEEDRWETTSSYESEGDGPPPQPLRPRSELQLHEDYEDIPVPSECFCAITRALMEDPVTTCDHFTYDREGISRWLHHRRLTSPMTNLPLESDSLTPNWEVRERIEKVVKEYLEVQERWGN